MQTEYHKFYFIERERKYIKLTSIISEKLCIDLEEDLFVIWEVYKEENRIIIEKTKNKMIKRVERE